MGQYDLVGAYFSSCFTCHLWALSSPCWSLCMCTFKHHAQTNSTVICIYGQRIKGVDKGGLEGLKPPHLRFFCQTLEYKNSIIVMYIVYCPKICTLLLLRWINSLPIYNKGIESVLFLCTWNVMQLLRWTWSVVVRSQVLRRALKLHSLRVLVAGITRITLITS